MVVTTADLDIEIKRKITDYVMFEYAQDQNQWLVHIFELKRSVGESEWTHLKAQFMGALQNALAEASFQLHNF